MRRLDGNGIVIGAEGSVNSRPPFPIHGYAGRVSEEGTLPDDVSLDLAAGIREAGRHGKSQAGQEDLIASGEWNRGYPGLREGVE